MPLLDSDFISILFSILRTRRKSHNANFVPHLFFFPVFPSIDFPFILSTSIYRLYHIRLILVLRIFLCSWKIPYMRASLVGGHPGT